MADLDVAKLRELATNLIETADYAIDRLKAVQRQQVVRDLDEALGGYRHARAALIAETALAEAREDGWVLVPREPTREMWAAGGNAVVGYKQRHHDKVVGDLWSAMLAAAPPPPAGDA